MTVGVLVLAGGYSGRFGCDKRMAQFSADQGLLDSAIANVQRAGLPLLLALRNSDEELEAALKHRGIMTKRCPHSVLGMGHTLADGISALPSRWSGILIALGDMPLIQPQTFRILRDAMGPGTIVAPTFAQQRGHPVGFDQAYFPELAQLGGDRGAGNLLEVHAQRVTSVTVNDPGILLDIDSPGQLDAWSD